MLGRGAPTKVANSSFPLSRPPPPPHPSLDPCLHPHTTRTSGQRRGLPATAAPATCASIACELRPSSTMQHADGDLPGSVAPSDGGGSNASPPAAAAGQIPASEPVRNGAEPEAHGADLAAEPTVTAAPEDASGAELVDSAEGGAEPSDAELVARLQQLLKEVDLGVTSGALRPNSDSNTAAHEQPLYRAPLAPLTAGPAPHPRPPPACREDAAQEAGGGVWVRLI